MEALKRTWLQPSISVTEIGKGGVSGWWGGVCEQRSRIVRSKASAWSTHRQPRLLRGFRPYHPRLWNVRIQLAVFVELELKGRSTKPVAEARTEKTLRPGQRAEDVVGCLKQHLQHECLALNGRVIWLGGGCVFRHWVPAEVCKAPQL